MFKTQFDVIKTSPHSPYRVAPGYSLTIHSVDVIDREVSVAVVRRFKVGHHSTRDAQNARHWRTHARNVVGHHMSKQKIRY